MTIKIMIKDIRNKLFSSKTKVQVKKVVIEGIFFFHMTIPAVHGSGLDPLPIQPCDPDGPFRRE